MWLKLCDTTTQVKCALIGPDHGWVWQPCELKYKKEQSDQWPSEKWLLQPDSERTKFWKVSSDPWHVSSYSWPFLNPVGTFFCTKLILPYFSSPRGGGRHIISVPFPEVRSWKGTESGLLQGTLMEYRCELFYNWPSIGAPGWVGTLFASMALLPNPIVVWTNESICNLLCEITGVSYKFPWFLGSIMVSFSSSFQRKIKF